MRQFLRYALYLTATMTSLVNARDLAEILRAGAMNNPEILEAQANQAVAEATLEQTRASRYPTLKATAQQYVMNSAGNSRKWSPGLTAGWTLYDFGQTSAKIEQNELETQYYGHKLNETTSEWAYTMAGYYLDALKCKLQLQAAKDSLALHQHIVNQMAIINQYDPGRRSELTQAQSRLVRVQDSIVTYERNLGLALRKMARYVQPAVGESELSNPFVNLNVHDLLDKYPMTQEHLETNETYLSQKRELERTQAALKVAERSLYPSVGIEATASRTQSAVYLTMSADVFNKTKFPMIDEQRYLIAAAQAKLDKIVDSLTQQAELAIIEMQQHSNQIAILERQIAALKQVVVDYEDQFKIATRTLLNVVDAYNELASAEQSKVTAEYNLMAAKLEYLSAVGAINKWAGIKQFYNPEEGSRASADIDARINKVPAEETVMSSNTEQAVVTEVENSTTQPNHIDSNRAVVKETSIISSNNQVNYGAASSAQGVNVPQSGSRDLSYYLSPHYPDLTTDYVYISEQKTEKQFVPVTETSDLVLKKSTSSASSSNQ